MADIAMVFHWTLDDMGRLPIDDLLAWRNRAVERHNQKMEFFARIAGAMK